MAHARLEPGMVVRLLTGSTRRTGRLEACACMVCQVFRGRRVSVLLADGSAVHVDPRYLERGDA